MKEEKIDIETAEKEFDRFGEGMDLDFDIGKMDDEDKNAFNKHKNRIISSIQKGHLVINQNDEAEYTPFRPGSKHKEAIIFHERTGASLMAQDGKKKNADVAKTYAVMGDMCKVAPKVFAGLAGADIKTCEAIFALLMD